MKKRYPQVPVIAGVEIPFLITRDELLKILGEPDEIDDESESMLWWDYKEPEATFHFDDEEGFRISQMIVYDKQYQFAGRKIIGGNKKSILEFVRKYSNRKGRVILDGWKDPESQVIEFGDIGLELWFKKRRLAFVTLTIVEPKTAKKKNPSGFRQKKIGQVHNE